MQGSQFFFAWRCIRMASLLVVTAIKHRRRQAFLFLLTTVAGDHPKNDMAGDEEDSRKSIITQSGIDCVPILKGTVEYTG